MPLRTAISRHVVALVFASGLALSAAAQVTTKQPESTEPVPPKMVAGRDNAALSYYRAWDQLVREDSNAIGEALKNEKGWFPNEDVTAVLVANERTIEELLRATEISECDWGIRHEEGFGALLPHLGKLRMTARWFVADARRLVRDGDITGAAKRIAGGVRIGDQLRHDQYLISTLVAAAINALMANATNVLFAEGVMTPEAARVIHTAFKAQHTQELFASETWITGEEWSSTVWTKRRHTGARAGAEFVGTLADMGYQDFQKNPTVKSMETMNEEQLHAEIDRMRPYYAEVRKVWSAPDCVKQLEGLQEKVEAGAYGPVAGFLAPSFSKARASMEKAVGVTRKVTKDLEAFMNEGKVPVQEAEKGAVPKAATVAPRSGK